MTRSPLVPSLALIVLTVAADQFVKYLVVANMALGEAIPLLPFLALYHARNEGIAFSMFEGFGDVGLSLLALLVLAFVAWLWWKTPRERTFTHVGFAIIVGGAIGNLIDRVSLGYVVDYIFFHTPVWSFAVFNLADAFITVGAGLVLLDEIVLARRERRPGGSPGSD